MYNCTTIYLINGLGEDTWAMVCAFHPAHVLGRYYPYEIDRYVNPPHVCLLLTTMELASKDIVAEDQRDTTKGVPIMISLHDFPSCCHL